MIPYEEYMLLELVFGVIFVLFVRTFFFKSQEKNGVDFEVGSLPCLVGERCLDSYSETEKETSKMRKQKGKKKIKSGKKKSPVSSSPAPTSTSSTSLDDHEHDSTSESAKSSTEMIEDPDPNAEALGQMEMLHCFWEDEKRNEISIANVFAVCRPSFLILSFLQPRDIAICRIASLDFWGWICRSLDRSPLIVEAGSKSSPKRNALLSDNVFSTNMSRNDETLDRVLDVLPNVSEADTQLDSSPYKNKKNLCEQMIDLALLKRRPDYAFMFINIMHNEDELSVETETKDIQGSYDTVYCFLYNCICYTLFTADYSCNKSSLSSTGGYVKQQLTNIQVVNNRCSHSSSKKSGGPARSLLQWIDRQSNDTEHSKFQFLDQIPGVSFCNKAIAFLETVSLPDEQNEKLTLSSTVTTLVRAHLGNITWAVSRAYIMISAANEAKSPKRNSKPSKKHVRNSMEQIYPMEVLTSPEVLVEKSKVDTQEVEKKENHSKKEHHSNEEHSREREHVNSSRDKKRRSTKKKRESQTVTQTNLTKPPIRILRRDSKSDKSVGSAASGESKYSSKSLWNAENNTHINPHNHSGNNNAVPQIEKRRAMSLDPQVSIGADGMVVIGKQHNPKHKSGPRKNKAGGGGGVRADSTSPRNNTKKNNGRFRQNKKQHHGGSNSVNSSGKPRSKRGGKSGNSQRRRAASSNMNNTNPKGLRKFVQRNGKPDLRVLVEDKRETGSAMNVMAAPFVPSFVPRSEKNEADAPSPKIHDKPVHSPSGNKYTIFQPFSVEPSTEYTKMSTFSPAGCSTGGWSSPPASSQKRPSLSPTSSNKKNHTVPNMKRLESEDMEPFCSSVDLSFLD